MFTEIFNILCCDEILKEDVAMQKVNKQSKENYTIIYTNCNLMCVHVHVIQLFL